MNTVFQKKKSLLRSFIPLHVSGRCFWNAYKVFAWIKVPKYVREKNKVRNRQRLRAADRAFWNHSDAYIENQSEWKDILFGAGPHHNMCYSGCEIIAAFNARKAFGFPGTPEQMAELIYDFEAQGAALLGEFGTSPAAIASYFRKKGFSVLVTTGENPVIFEKISRVCPAVIATVYNDKYDILKQVHTVCITGNSHQGYVVHNAYRRDAQGKYTASCSYGTLMQAVENISGYETKLISLIGLTKKG